MTMKTLRDQQRAERLAYVERLIARAGSIRAAAKLAGMDRSEFRRQWKSGRKSPILTASTPARTS